MYRKDLFDKAGIKMPESPTWDFVADAARKITVNSETYGICLRGKAGWGENMAFLSATANSFGARWFDEEMEASVRSAGMERSLELLRQAHARCRPPGASRMDSMRILRCSTPASAACGSMRPSRPPS